MNTLDIQKIPTPETIFTLPHPQDNSRNAGCERNEDLDGCTLSPSQDEGPKILPQVSQEVTCSKALHCHLRAKVPLSVSELTELKLNLINLIQTNKVQ